MDAKVGDWVVTPRRGKAVEINAPLVQRAPPPRGLAPRGRSLRRGGDDRARTPSARVHVVQRALLASRQAATCYDVVDGPSGRRCVVCGPTRSSPISLDAPGPRPERGGPRSSTRSQTQSRHAGGPAFAGARSAGLQTATTTATCGRATPPITRAPSGRGSSVPSSMRAARRAPTTERRARALSRGFAPHLGEACIGSISEIFDAEPPYTPRGCIAQAWSVAEVLRVLAT